MFDSSSDSPLVRNLKSNGLDMQGLHEENKKSLTECWQTVIDKSSGKFRKPLKAGYIDDIKFKVVFFGLQLMILLSLPLGVVAASSGDFLPASFFLGGWAVCTRYYHQDTLIRGCFRWLGDRINSGPPTDEAVIEYLQKQLRHKEERAFTLGADLADERKWLKSRKDQLEKELRKYTRKLEKSGAPTSLRSEFESIIRKLEREIAATEELLERYDKQLDDVRRKAQNLANLLPEIEERKTWAKEFKQTASLFKNIEDERDAAEKKLEAAKDLFQHQLGRIAGTLDKASHLSDTVDTVRVKGLDLTESEDALEIPERVAGDEPAASSGHRTQV